MKINKVIVASYAMLFLVLFIGLEANASEADEVDEAVNTGAIVDEATIDLIIDLMRIEASEKLLNELSEATDATTEETLIKQEIEAPRAIEFELEDMRDE